MAQQWCIGVGLPRWRDAAGPLYDAISRASRQHNFALQYLGYYDPDHLVERVAQATLDGLILYASQDMGRQISQRLNGNVPVLALVPELECFGWPSVVPDWAGAARLAVQHLRQTGYRRVALVHTTRGDSAQAACDAFVRVAGPTGVTRQTDSSFDPKQRDADEQRIIAELAAWLVSLATPVGIVAQEETLSHCVAQACRKAGLSIPNDVGLISLFDGVPCTCASPPITAVHLPVDRGGELIVETMVNLLHGRPVESVVIPITTVNPRASTGMADDQAIYVADALRYIQNHACDGASVDDIINHLQVISRTKLYELFEQRVGRSPAAELRRTRIDCARRLLTGTRLPVAEVAHRSGFPHSRHFSTIFRRETGLSPTEYRQLGPGKSPNLTAGAPNQSPGQSNDPD